MTDELDKQFFQCFGIEPDITSCYHRCKRDLNCKECDEATKIYPQITDRILLELICMANQHEDYPISTNIKNIYARTLRILLRTEKLYKKYHGSDERYKKLVKRVRKLFKER